MVSLRLGISPLQDTCLRPRLSRTTIDVEMGNRPGIRILLLIFHERIRTYSVRFSLFGREQAWLDNKLVVKKSGEDPLVFCEAAHSYVTTKLVDLILDIGKQPNSIH